MPKYLSIIEKVDDSFSAYLPDVPGCVAAGTSQEEAVENLRAALQIHLQGIREDESSVPEPRTVGQYIQVD